MKRYLYILSILGIGFAVGWTASAWRFGLPFLAHSDHHPPPPSQVFSRLNLSEAQKQKVDSLHEEHMKVHFPLREEADTARREFDSLVERTKNLDDLKSGYRKFLDAKRALDWDHFELMMQVHSVLTLAQIRQLRQQGPGPGKHPPPNKGPPPGKGPPPHKGGW